MIHTKFQAPAIDIKHVYYLMMLDQLGSISKAANALGVAQPSLSENITRLEKSIPQLGVEPCHLGWFH